MDEKPPTWHDGHSHEWVVMSDDMAANERYSPVKCKLCEVPGELDERTKEVYWPAT